MASKIPHPQPERPAGTALVGLPEKQAGNRPRAHVRIERRSCALLDSDNFAGGCKALIDCLRQADLIEDDDPESVEITYAQVRVAHKKDEGTFIVIEGPDHGSPPEGVKGTIAALEATALHRRENYRRGFATIPIIQKEGASNPQAAGVRQKTPFKMVSLKFNRLNEFQDHCTQVVLRTHQAVESALTRIISHLNGGNLPPIEDAIHRGCCVIQNSGSGSGTVKTYHWDKQPILQVTHMADAWDRISITPLVEIPGLTAEIKPIG